MIKTGTAVWCRSASLIPAGGRVVAPAGRPGRWWVNICITGQHWPHVADAADLVPLDAVAAESLGMCGGCLGFGTAADLPDPMWPYMIAEIPSPCGGCGGTGRPALRLTVTRAAGTVVSHLVTLPHRYVEPAATGPPGVCLACCSRSDANVHQSGVSVLAV
jgi:hypothetical protein